jgi:type IV pilus assembly protein PilO
MNLLEQLKTLDPRSLDPRDPGRWPGFVRAFCVLIVLLVCTGFAWYFMVWDDDRPELQKAQQQELDLRAQFENKQQQAANLAAYKAQLGEMERTFGAMLRQLPGRTEVPNLLVDISQTGLAAGLQEKLFQPMGEQAKGFYAELPIRIRLVGSYHQFGAFVSGIAALPRIVTLHDIEIKPVATTGSTSFDNLTMDVTAKTYRYIEDDGNETSAKSGKKSGGPT